MLAYFQPSVGSKMEKPSRWVIFTPKKSLLYIWPNIGLKQLSIGYHTTQWLGSSIIENDPHWVENNPNNLLKCISPCIVFSWNQTGISSHVLLDKDIYHW